MSKAEKSKKPFFKRWWFWVIVAIIVIFGTNSTRDGSDNPGTDTPSTADTSITTKDTTNIPDEPTDFILDLSILPEFGETNIDTGSLKLQFGELMNVNYGGNGVIVIKAKIKSQSSNDLTVKQNYHSVCDLILNHGFNTCTEIQYWAVADMSDGSEQKVVSFTMNAAAIQGVYNQTIVAINLAECLDDLFIHNSLKSGSNNSAQTETNPPVTSANVPAEYKSALRSAQNYNDLMHMSKAGLYDQLTSEYGDNFSADAAQYAVDNVNADWNANALAKANSYSDQMHMSKSGIYNQLVSEYGEKFTEKEAQYAIDNISADWNINALAKAKQYKEMGMSSNNILNQLISEYGEGFTESEANYAIEHLND